MTPTLIERIEDAGLKLLADPIVRPGSYSLHLYCRYKNPAHEYGEFPHEIDQFQKEATAERYARRRGWILHRDGTSTCPKCAAALKARSA